MSTGEVVFAREQLVKEVAVVRDRAWFIEHRSPPPERLFDDVFRDFVLTGQADWRPVRFCCTPELADVFCSQSQHK